MKIRRFLTLMLCLCMVASLFTGVVSTASADDVIVYTVKNDDYLFKICKNLGLDYYQCKKAIMVLNGYSSELQLNRISVGQTIKLPASNAVAATVSSSSTTTTSVTTTTVVNGVSTTTTTTNTVAGTPGVAGGYTASYYLVPYTVKYGDTLNSICNSYGTSYAAYGSQIMAINGLKSANSIWAGKTIYIPASAPTAGACYGVVAHTVRSGETVTSILNSYGSSVGAASALMTGLNGSTNLNRILVGQTLYIPVVATASSTVPSSVPGTPSVPASSGYSIAFEATACGKPYAVVGNAQVTAAPSGKTVAIVAAPSSTYALKSITVVRTDTHANVPLSGNTFEMPASNVLVTVTYNAGMKINKANVANGTFVTCVNGSETECANYGDKVTVVPQPKNGYSVNYDGSNYVVYYTKVGSSSKQEFATRNSDGTFSFVMPNYEIKLYVEFTAAKMYKVLQNCTQGVMTFKVDGTTVTHASKDVVVNVSIAPSAGYAVWVGSVNVKYAGNTKSVPVTMIDNNTYSFVMPADDAVVSATMVKTDYYKINSVSSDYGFLTYLVVDQYTGVSQVAEQAKAGDTVYIVPHSQSGFIFRPLYTTVKYANATTKVASYDANTYSFVMPAAEVTVNPLFAADATAVRYKVGLNNDIHGTVVFQAQDDFKDDLYADGITVLSGRKMRVAIIPDNGFTYAAVLVLRASDNVDVSASVGLHTIGTNYFEFTQPNYEVYVAVPYAETTNYAVNKSASGNKSIICTTSGVTVGKLSTKVNGVEIAENDTIKAGSIVSVTPPVGPGHVFKKLRLTVTTTGGTTVNFDSASNPGMIALQPDGSYAYLVKQEDAKLTWDADYEAIPYTVYGSASSLGSYTINGSTDSFVKAYAGQLVTLKITPNAGAVVDKVIYNERDVTLDADLTSTPATYSFIMQAGDIKTQVEFKDAVETPVVFRTITVNVTGGTGSSTTAAEGSTIYIPLVPNDPSATITSLTMNGIPQPIPTTPGTYNFPLTVPTTDVVINATF